MQKFLSYAIKPTFDVDKPNYAKVTLAPLEKGMGTTLGNALRRVCLTDIPGASVFAIEIPGVTHEFQAMDGVSEDVTQIILNLKQLVIKVDSNIYPDENFEDLKLENWPVLSIDVHGPKKVTGADIVCPTGFSIVNPELHICDVTAPVDFQMSIYAQTGRGFVSQKENRERLNSLNVIATDSSFSPVLVCNWTVSEEKATKYTTTDSLSIDLQTNGSMSASDVLATAASILMAHFAPISSLNEIISQQEFLDQNAANSDKQEISVAIDTLELSPRSLNGLRKAGIVNVHDLISKTTKQIWSIKNLGSKSVNEIVNKIHESGLKFKDEEK